ncbi:hypothetical protein [Malacoplasma penetrans]|nr:hypothetical protein [Malacoplasma penetrans]
MKIKKAIKYLIPLSLTAVVVPISTASCSLYNSFSSNNGSSGNNDNNSTDGNNTTTTDPSQENYYKCTTNYKTVMTTLSTGELFANSPKILNYFYNELNNVQLLDEFGVIINLYDKVEDAANKDGYENSDLAGAYRIFCAAYLQYYDFSLSYVLGLKQIWKNEKIYSDDNPNEYSDEKKAILKQLNDSLNTYNNKNVRNIKSLLEFQIRYQNYIDEQEKTQELRKMFGYFNEANAFFGSVSSLYIKLNN